MLALKLLLVPSFLLAVTFVERRFGPEIAGWIAGMPIVTGPILFVLALENGPAFARTASAASLSAVFATATFAIAYARLCRHLNWQATLALALSAWLCAIWALSLAPPASTRGWAAAAVALVFAPMLFPAVRVAPSSRRVGHGELGVRMAGGALLTVLVTLAANRIGGGWSGLVAVFPVLGTVLAVSSHRRSGPLYSAVLLRGMASGMYAFAAFCLVLTTTLASFPVPAAFLAAIVAGISVQVLTRTFLTASAQSHADGRDA